MAWSKVTKSTTSFGKVVKPATTFAKNVKPTTTFEGGRKYTPMYLLNQTGGRLLLQSGLFMNIGEVQQNTFDLTVKPATSFTKIAKT